MRDALATPLRLSAAARVITYIAEMLASGQLSGTVFAVYSPIGSELDVSRLARALRAGGIATAYPRVAKRQASGTPATLRATNLELVLVTDERELAPGHLGILEPHAGTPIDPTRIDVFIVPALAVTLDGHRLGYGGGYYDEVMTRAPRATRVACVYDTQILPDLPTSSTDAILDWIVSDTRGPRRVSPERVSGRPS